MEGNGPEHHGRFEDGDRRFALGSALAAGPTGPGRLHAQQSDPWVVPAGFHVSVFAEGVENARSMAVGPRGTVFVGSHTGDKVHAVIDSDGDHRADRVVVLATGLEQPNGVAIRAGRCMSRWRTRSSCAAGEPPPSSGEVPSAAQRLMRGYCARIGRPH
jgi:glucose/arabinose dehydrogenase